MAPTWSTHQSLLIRLRTGDDSAAWDEWFDRYRDLVAAYARRRGLQPADADDVTQVVLHDVGKSLRTFNYDPARGRFRDYLKTAAIREIWRRLRDNAANPLPVGDAAEEVPVEDAAEREWESEWRQYHIRLAMRRIRQEFNARDFAAFDLYAGEGREAALVAGELGLSLDQVYQAKSRILRRLKSIVAEQVAEEG